MNVPYREAIEEIKKYWYTPLGFVILSILVLLSIDTLLPTNYKWLIQLFITIIIILFWYNNKTINKASKNKLGFAIAIRTLDEKEEKKIKEAFIYELRDQLSSSGIKNRFQLVEIQQYYVNKIQNNQDAADIVRKARCHLMLHGSAQLGIHKGEECHFLKLHETAIHSPIPKAVHNAYKKEMGELFRIPHILPVDDDVTYFEIKAAEFNYAARYIIGLAALLSRYTDVAIVIFEELQNIFNEKSIVPTLKRKIQDKLDLAYFSKAHKYHLRWVNNDDIHDLQKSEKYLLRIKEQNNPFICSIRAICLFVLHKDISAARQQVLKCKGKIDNTWRFNLAFLDAYEGHLDIACKQITKACKEATNAEVAYQVQLFIERTINKEPDKYTLYLLLGVINQDLKGDSKLAKKYFNKFLELSNRTEDESIVNIVRSRLGEIKNTNTIDEDECKSKD